MVRGRAAEALIFSRLPARTRPVQIGAPSVVSMRGAVPAVTAFQRPDPALACGAPLDGSPERASSSSTWRAAPGLPLRGITTLRTPSSCRGVVDAFVPVAAVGGGLLREPAVPMLVKSLPFAAALYVVSPLDVIPDVLPVIGEIDDLAIVLLGIKTFLRLCPAAVTAFHREAIAQGRAFSPMTPRDAVLDAEFRPGP